MILLGGDIYKINMMTSTSPTANYHESEIKHKRKHE